MRTSPRSPTPARSTSSTGRSTSSAPRVTTRSRSAEAFTVVLDSSGPDVAKKFHDLLYENQPERAGPVPLQRRPAEARGRRRAPTSRPSGTRSSRRRQEGRLGRPRPPRRRCDAGVRGDPDRPAGREGVTRRPHDRRARQQPGRSAEPSHRAGRIRRFALAPAARLRRVSLHRLHRPHAEGRAARPPRRLGLRPDRLRAGRAPPRARSPATPRSCAGSSSSATSRTSSRSTWRSST